MKASFFTESILYWLAKGISAIAQRAPTSFSVAWGSWVGGAAYHLLGYRREIALKNLRAAFGGSYSEEEYQGILKKVFQNIGMTFMEVASLPRFDRAYVEQWIQIAPESRQRLEAARSQGHGTILVTAHFGNWELASIVGALHGYPTLVLARQQGWPRLNALLNRNRESKGCRVVTKGFSVRELIRGLHQGQIVGILADQDGGINGVLAPFFGRLASTAPGAIALSVGTQAPVLPVFIIRRHGAAHTLIVEEPLPLAPVGSLEERIRQGVAAYLKRLEEMIRRYPDQWLWLHRRWKSSPDRRLILLSDGKAGHLAQLRAFRAASKAAWARKTDSDRRLQGFQRSFLQTETVEIRFRHSLWRGITCLVTSILPRRWMAADLWLRLALTKDSYRSLHRFPADWSVSCGAGTAPVNLLLSRKIGSRAIHILRSRFPSWRRFDLAVIPRHDLVPQRAGALLSRGKLLVVDGALVVRPFDAHDGQLKIWCDLLGITKDRQIGLLLGGPTRGLKLDNDQVEKLVRNLLKVSEALDAELLVTTSRRTPPAVERYLSEELAVHPRCRLLVLVNRQEAGGLKDTSQAVPCILGLSDLLVVSGDSISMVSEAVATSKPVVSFLPEGTGLSLGVKKYHRFLRQLARQGRVMVADPKEVGEAVIQAMNHQQASSVKRQVSGGNPIEEYLVQWL